MRTLPLALTCLATTAMAQQEDIAYWVEAYPAVAGIIEEAETTCADLGGTVSVEGPLFVPADLDGDAGRLEYGEWDDLVVDLQHLRCSTAFTAWAGSGGSPIYFVLDGETVFESFGYVWEVERVGTSYPAVILVGRHGSNCDGAGVDPCVQAYIAHEGRFLTTGQ